MIKGKRNLDLECVCPGERPSYAGLRVEVLERPDSELIVQYQGHTVATQEHRRAWAHCGL